jgi:hypothetical protein
MTMMASNKNIDDDDVMTQIQAMVRLLSPSPPMPDTRVAIITTWIATMPTMHAAAAAQIVGETTRALKILGGTTRGTGIMMQRHTTTNKGRVQQEVEPPNEKQREATGQHNKQPNKRGAMERREADVPAEGFGEAERAADKRSGQQERQQRFLFVVGCVVVCDIFYSFLVYMLGNCYALAGGVKKELVFART